MFRDLNIYVSTNCPYSKVDKWIRKEFNEYLVDKLHIETPLIFILEEVAYKNHQLVI